MIRSQHKRTLIVRINDYDAGGKLHWNSDLENKKKGDFKPMDIDFSEEKANS